MVSLSGPPVESKVIAGTLGAGAGQVITAFVVWLLDAFAFTRGDVPIPVVAFVGLVITTGLAFAAAYSAPHTPRPDLAGDGVTDEHGL